MEEQTKPNIVVSKCFLEPVRYNGARISNSLVDRLKNFANLIPVCPEMEIGLGAPRVPLRLVDKKGSVHMVQLKTQQDVTGQMLDFGQNFMAGLKDIDGFILKSKSPSCGISYVKIYSSTEKKPPIRRGKGLFGGMAKEHYPFLQVESESRIMDPDIGENFLTGIFALACLRGGMQNIKKSSQLVAFHTRFKLMSMAFSQKHASKMGKIVANHEKLPFAELLSRYRDTFRETFSRRATRKTHINVLLHIFGYFSGEITREERERYLYFIERYRNGDIPLNFLAEISKVYIARTDKKYLKDQKYFNPFPEKLRYKNSS